MSPSILVRLSPLRYNAARPQGSLQDITCRREVHERKDTSILAANADVVVLDLVEFVTEEDKPAARERVRSAINALQGCGAEVFAQVDAELLYADAYACVWPGLTG